MVLRIDGFPALWQNQTVPYAKQKEYEPSRKAHKERLLYDRIQKLKIRTCPHQ